MDQPLSSNRQQCSKVGRMESVREKGNALNKDVAKSLLTGPPANQKSAAAATAVRRRQITGRVASTTGVSMWLWWLVAKSTGPWSPFRFSLPSTLREITSRSRGSIRNDWKTVRPRLTSLFSGHSRCLCSRETSPAEATRASSSSTVVSAET